VLDVTITRSSEVKRRNEVRPRKALQRDFLHLQANSSRTNASDPRAQWRVEGNKIVNGAGESLDIRGENKSDGAELVSYDQKNQANQHWRLEYV